MTGNGKVLTGIKGYGIVCSRYHASQHAVVALEEEVRKKKVKSRRVSLRSGHKVDVDELWYYRRRVT